jgi:N-acetylglucosaminyl-diphospho-decaprenol L-rhamnosyltransferase
VAAAQAGTGIAAIVVSHESAATIDDCLARLRVCAGVAEIRVIDNGSRDATVSIVQRHALADPRVRFVADPGNPGFSAACNRGADGSQAPWLAFVNPDCLPEPDALSAMRAHAVALAAAGTGAVVGADLVDESGVRDAAARRRDPDLVAMLSSAAARELGVAVEGAALQRVDAVSGALMLMPRTLFARIGGFDTGYRLHAEDLDLCRRARAAGAVVAVANDVRVVHVRGVSSRARPLFVAWNKHRGLWRYFRKFDGHRHALPTQAVVLLAIAAHFVVDAGRALLR